VGSRKQRRITYVQAVGSIHFADVAQLVDEGSLNLLTFAGSSPAASTYQAVGRQLSADTRHSID